MVPFYDDGQTTVYADDCLNVLTSGVIVPKSIDLVLTSPPFNVGMSYERDEWETVSAYHEWLLERLNAVEPLLASGAWVVVEINDGFVSPEHSQALPRQKEQWIMPTGARIVLNWHARGLYYKGEAVWNRGRWINDAAGRLVCANGSPSLLVQHSKVLFARQPGGRKGVGSFDRSLNDKKALWCRSVWDHIKPEHNPDHPAVMPYSMASGIVEMWSLPGHTVLDLFSGSGTVLRAAKDFGRKAIGIERDPAYARLSALRVSQHVLPLDFEEAAG